MNKFYILLMISILIISCSPEPKTGDSKDFNAWDDVIDGTATITAIDEKTISFDWQSDEFPENKQSLKNIEIKKIVGLKGKPDVGDKLSLKKIDLFEQIGTTTPQKTDTVWSVE